MRTVEAVWGGLPIVVAVTALGTGIWAARAGSGGRTPGRWLLALAVAGWCGVVMVAIGLAQWQPGRRLMPLDRYAVPPVSLLPLRPLRRLAGGQAITTGMWEQMGGNLLLLAPLGVLVPLLTGARPAVGRVALLAAGASVGLEALQLIGRFGIADIDDVLLNSAGVTLAYVALRAAERTVSRWRRSGPWRPVRRRTP